jgi:hypothetical protein
MTSIRGGISIPLGASPRTVRRAYRNQHRISRLARLRALKFQPVMRSERVWLTDGEEDIAQIHAKSDQGDNLAEIPATSDQSDLEGIDASMDLNTEAH